MLRALLFSLTTALAGMANAQTNLVLNGSFEDTVSCDLPVIGIRKAAHWYTSNLATPDVWDADLVRGCGYDLDPNGFPGWWYLTPFEGLRHAGEYFWFGPGSSNTREYMMTKLALPLEAGSSYEVSLRYALRPTFRYAVDHVGIWLGVDSLFEPTPNWVSVTPQIKLRDPVNTYLAETQAWTLLKDTLVAIGGEVWMVIGNFDVADSVNGINAYPNALNASAYYYFDSVSVRKVVGSTRVDELMFIAGWSELGLWVRWNADLLMTELQIMDARGRLVAMQKVTMNGKQGLIKLPSLAPGLYVVRAAVGDDWYTSKFVKGEGGL